jgi:hypothetical protein
MRIGYALRKSRLAIVTNPSRLSIPVYVIMFEWQSWGSSADMPFSGSGGFWNAYIAALYDINSKMVSTTTNTQIHDLPKSTPCPSSPINNPLHVPPPFQPPLDMIQYRINSRVMSWKSHRRESCTVSHTVSACLFNGFVFFELVFCLPCFCFFAIACIIVGGSILGEETSSVAAKHRFV